MPQITVTFPNIFANLSGNQPASKLDDNFNVLTSSALLSIKAKILTGAFTPVVPDDTFVFLLCNPVGAITVTLPASPTTGFAFWISNESSQVVTLGGTVFINNTSFLNPTLVADYTPYFKVKGGLVQWSGARWDFYPLFMGRFFGHVLSSSAVVAGATSLVITHGFNQAGIYVTTRSDWNTVAWQTAQTNTTVTLAFSTPAPAAGGTIYWMAVA